MVSAGLSFVNDTVLERRAPPAPLRCYVCGQKYLNHTSLDLWICKLQWCSSMSLDKLSTHNNNVVLPHSVSTS